MVFRNCSSVVEALVTVSLLRDGGFDADIDNFNHATLDWFIIPALGGVQIRLPASQFDAAKLYLVDMADTAGERLTKACGEPDAMPLRTRRLRAFSMIFLYFGGGSFLFMPIFWLISKLPADWFPQEPLRSGPVFEFSPITVGCTHANYDTLLTIMILIGIVLFTMIDISGFRKQHKQDEPS